MKVPSRVLVSMLLRKQDQPPPNTSYGATKLRLERLAREQAERPRDDRGRPLEVVVPSNIDSVEDAQLGDLLMAASRLLAWSSSIAALESVKAAEARRERDIAKAKAYLTATGDGKARSARAALDEDALAATAKFEVQEGIAKLTEAQASGFESIRNALSREITRRVNLNGGRGNNGPLHVPPRPHRYG